jgi:predicted glycoside hydrolase/deacetylase ChbG (UPF0249 family)
MIRLVVDAAQFGRSAETNAAILRAHREGVVTSTSVVGNTEHPDEVTRELAGAPRLGVGLALALIGGRPIAAPGDLPALVDGEGRLRAQARPFAFDWLRGRIPAAEVEMEFEAQIVRAERAGWATDHLCTVGHLGFLPGVGKIIERLARRHRIAGVRTDVEAPALSWVTDPARGLGMGVLSGLAWLTRRQLGATGHGPQTWGYVESGRLDEIRILELLGRMGPGAHELICHPGVKASTQSPGEVATPGTSRELSALTSARVRTAIERRHIVLCRWQELY